MVGIFSNRGDIISFIVFPIFALAILYYGADLVREYALSKLIFFIVLSYVGAIWGFYLFKKHN